jgi:hypothetical protein
MTSTLFEKAGDMVTATLDVGEHITLDNYVRRHILLHGALTVSYPGTDQPSEGGLPGGVFPTREFYPLSDATFAITAEEDNTLFYCVLPGYNNERLTYREFTLEPGDVYSVDVKHVAFVYGDNYTVNSNTRTQASVLACENNSSLIQATEACRGVDFYIIPKTS